MATDDESLRQIAELREEIAAKRVERDATRRRLHALEERAAELGRDAPPHITNEITDLIGERKRQDTLIAELGRQIARLELAPTSGLVIPPGEVLPQLVPAVIDTRLHAVEVGLDRQAQATDRIERRLDAWEARKAQDDAARRDGQQGRRRDDWMLRVILFILAVGVMLIVIRVY